MVLVEGRGFEAVQQRLCSGCLKDGVNGLPTVQRLKLPPKAALRRPWPGNSRKTVEHSVYVRNSLCQATRSGSLTGCFKRSAVLLALRPRPSVAPLSSSLLPRLSFPSILPSSRDVSGFQHTKRRTQPTALRAAGGEIAVKPQRNKATHG